MYETNLAQAELCFSDFTEATLFSCDLKGVTAEETCFKKMVADGCTFRGSHLYPQQLFRRTAPELSHGTDRLDELLYRQYRVPSDTHGAGKNESCK